MSLFTKHLLLQKAKLSDLTFVAFTHCGYLQKSVFFVFYPFFPSPQRQKFSAYLYLDFRSHPLMDFDPFLCLQVCPHPTGSKWPAQVSPASPSYGTAHQHFFVKILLLDETTGSAFFSSILSFSSHLPFLLCLHSFLNSHPQSFNYIFCVKDYKSAPLHTTVLKHWCQNLNFLLNPSHLICLWLAKLNTSEVKFNLLPSNHVFLFLFLLSLHLGPSYPILFVMS